MLGHILFLQMTGCLDTGGLVAEKAESANQLTVLEFWPAAAGKDLQPNFREGGRFPPLILLQPGPPAGGSLWATANQILPWPEGCDPRVIPVPTRAGQFTVAVCPGSREGARCRDEHLCPSAHTLGCTLSNPGSLDDRGSEEMPEGEVWKRARPFGTSTLDTGTLG